MNVTTQWLARTQIEKEMDVRPAHASSNGPSRYPSINLNPSITLWEGHLDLLMSKDVYLSYNTHIFISFKYFALEYTQECITSVLLSYTLNSP